MVMVLMRSISIVIGDLAAQGNFRSLHVYARTDYAHALRLYVETTY